MNGRFADRAEAGKKLAQQLESYENRDDVIVLGLPRGGVPVAFEVAKALGAPMDVFLVRKLGVPGHEELAMGAIASGNITVWNEQVLDHVPVDASAREAVVQREEAELARRERAYRKGLAAINVENKVVIVVDDGLATGASMNAAVKALRRMNPRRIVVAVPAGAEQAVAHLRALADEVVCPYMPYPFYSVGSAYDDFTATEDSDVVELLKQQRQRVAPGETDKASRKPTHTAQSQSGQMQTCMIRAGNVELEGELHIPDGAIGVVLFAHGSGSSRHSPRNQFVARTLRQAGLGTVLMDLLTEEEEKIDAYTRELRFDLEMLSRRLSGATDWLREQSIAQGLPIGYFGASTGAGAALIAAARQKERVSAVVSRGGRPDLAEDFLPQVTAPTLLIVGSLDTVVIGMNQRAMKRLTAPKRLEIVQGATHLFEEPGTLEQVALLARQWFENYFMHQVRAAG